MNRIRKNLVVAVAGALACASAAVSSSALPAPAPLSPAESMKRMILTPGMEISLFASEPEITKVIAGAFDARGRFWAVESPDYPHGRTFHPDNSLNPFGGHDRIKICEDTNGDGKADKFTVFVDKLNMATSVTFGGGGVIVGMPPYILQFTDANGDDKADAPQGKILYNGFGTWDAHIGMSNLRYGPDNMLWGTSGWAAGKVLDVDMYMTVFRARWEGGKIERIANATNNIWGLGFNEFGQPFHSTANIDHSWATVIPNRYFAKLGQETPPNQDGTVGDVNSGKHTSKKIFPATDDVTQVDWKGGYTSATSHEIYTARLFPKAYWNSAAFVNEATGHLVHRCWVQPKGTAFEGTAPAGVENNLMASTDAWTAPVANLVGPDGALWVVDWYNYVIQHNKWMESQTLGAGNAYVNPDRDFTHGRIYRIYPKGAVFPPKLDLSKATPSQLVEALKNDNMFWRTTAQRMLVEAKDASVLAALAKLVEDRSADSLGLNPAAQHALWTMQGLGAFATDASTWVKWALMGLGHPARGVRMAALDAVPRTAASLTALKAHNLLNDADPQIRLKALLTLSDMAKGTAPAAGKLEMFKDYAALDAVTDTAFKIAASRVEIVKSETLPVGVITENGGPKSLDRTLYMDASGRLVGGSGFDATEGRLTLFTPQGRKAGFLAASGRIPAEFARNPHLYLFEGPAGVRKGWIIPLR